MEITEMRMLRRMTGVARREIRVAYNWSLMQKSARKYATVVGKRGTKR